MFLQIHFLTSHHASLLNRDDAGLAKRISFGGAPRLRVSSQCQKKHWRDALMQRLGDLPFGVRSRLVFRKVAEEAMRAGVPENRAISLADALGNAVMKLAEGRKGKNASVFQDPEKLELAQPILLGWPEVRYLARIVQEAHEAHPADEAQAKKAVQERVKKLEKKNVQALVREAGLGAPACGVEGALFGRFITSDILARVDAPVHVAHAFTVHELDTEMDYFTVVDDLLEERDETGAAHVNETELGAGIFYGYVAVDVPLLVSNLTGCRREEWRKNADEPAVRAALEELVRVIAQVSPGAKLGATAPYAWAECVLLEAGEAQPRSLANAFLQPVPLRSGRDPMQEAVDRLAAQIRRLQQMYGDTGEKRWVATDRDWPAELGERLPLGEAVGKALDRVLGSGA